MPPSYWSAARYRHFTLHLLTNKHDVHSLLVYLGRYGVPAQSASLLSLVCIVVHCGWSIVVGVMSVKSGRLPPRSKESKIGNAHTPIATDMGLGLQAIYRACYRIYPDQPSPLQVTALRKFWMGGPDPLDYIYMFSNPGSAEAHSPPHWHYVTNGLSDLYGDARLHK